MLLVGLYLKILLCFALLPLLSNLLKGAVPCKQTDWLRYCDGAGACAAYLQLAVDQPLLGLCLAGDHARV